MPLSLWDYDDCFIRLLKSSEKYVTKKASKLILQVMSTRPSAILVYSHTVRTACVVSHSGSTSCVWSQLRNRNMKVEACLQNWTEPPDIILFNTLIWRVNVTQGRDLSKITQTMRDTARTRAGSALFPGLSCLLHRDSAQQLVTLNRGLGPAPAAEDAAPPVAMGQVAPAILLGAWEDKSPWQQVAIS